jgi:hypothetical protein
MGSLFGKIAKVSKEDDGPSNEDIDREFDGEIADIALKKVDAVDAAAILDPGYKIAGAWPSLLIWRRFIRRSAGAVDGRLIT